MDRRRRRTRGLILGAAGLAAGAALAAEPPGPLRALAWVAPQADPVAVFASEPTECLRSPQDETAAQSVEVGRAAFRTPILLGGQAARAGLTCESCHRAGRGNPDFRFPGVSGAAGTADVTSSLFSSHRGNGVHDPVPIPDLSGPRTRLKVAPADLEAFIRGLVMEEFDGREPPAAVLRGLADYVRALGPDACPTQARSPTGPGPLVDDARRALVAGEAALAAGDRPTALLMIAAARARLGLIDERFAGLPAERARLRAADAALLELQAAVREARPDAAAGLAGWRTDSQALEAALTARTASSLFAPERLREATKRRLPAKPS